MDPLIPNPTGVIDAVHCGQFLVVSGLPHEFFDGFFQGNSSGNFATWQPWHSVAMTITGGRLANLTIDDSVRVTWLGDVVPVWGDTWILDKALDNSWIKTADGAIWLIWLVDQYELWDWFLFDDLTILAQQGGYGPGRIVNIDRCEVVRAD